MEILNHYHESTIKSNQTNTRNKWINEIEQSN
jgi:hypothetical protein